MVWWLGDRGQRIWKCTISYIKVTASLTLERVVEVPLRTWRDVDGSSLGFGAMVGAATDLLRIRSDLARRRRNRAKG